MLPNFLIIGAQKCGTSWLHRMLSQHPRVWMPPDKELEYFSYAGHPRSIGPAGYAAIFAEHSQRAGPGDAIGEATPSYFWTRSGNPGRPEEMSNDPAAAAADLLGPKARLIICLRDPVQRAVSAYLHHIAHGNLDPTTPLLKAPSSLGIVDMGFYATHLANWMDHFDTSNFLLLDYHKELNQLGLDRVCNFLQVEQFDFAEIGQTVFPGLTRVNLESGVWIAADETRRYQPAPAVESDDFQRRFTCVVEASALDELEKIYRIDKRELSELASGFSASWL